jgi:hypothetical protein
VEYLKSKIKELENNSQIKNIRELCRDISDFTKGYQPRTNLVKDEMCDLVLDSSSIVATWRKYISQLLNVQGVNVVRKTEIHTAGLLVPEPSAFEFDMAIEKPRSHKSPGIDQIPEELIKAGGKKIHPEIHKVSTFIRNNDKLPEEWKTLIIVPICKKGDKTDCNNYSGISLLPTMYKFQSNILFSKLIPYAEKIIGVHQCEF